MPYSLFKAHAAANSSPFPDSLQFPSTLLDRTFFKLLSHHWICPVELLSYLTLPVLCSPIQTCIRTPSTGVQHSYPGKLRRASGRDRVTGSRLACSTQDCWFIYDILNYLFLTLHLDVLLLTETLIRSFSKLLPPDCVFFSLPRLLGKDGGLATIFKNKLELRQLPSPTFSSFEVQLLELVGPPMTVL